MNKVNNPLTQVFFLLGMGGVLFTAVILIGAFVANNWPDFREWIMNINF
jgi:hypothetical protein